MSSARPPGVFPAACGSVGLFGENERAQLISAGLQLSQTARVQAVREKFYGYFAVTVPSERLWISWPAAGLDGSSNTPSVIVTEAQALTGAAPRTPEQLGLSGAVNRSVAMEQLAAGPGLPGVPQRFCGRRWTAASRWRNMPMPHTATGRRFRIWDWPGGCSAGI